jgi:hypothetical protein
MKQDKNVAADVFQGVAIGAVIVALVLYILVRLAHAQAPVQQVPTELRASQVCAEARGTGAQTVTLTPPAGMFVYLNSLEANAFAQGGSVGISTPASLTSTNLPNSPTFGMFAGTSNLVNTAGTQMGSYFGSFSGNGMKAAAAGVAVTVVAPSVTNMGWHLALCGYFAP